MYATVFKKLGGAVGAVQNMINQPAALVGSPWPRHLSILLRSRDAIKQNQ